MLQQLRRRQHFFSDISAWALGGVQMQDTQGTLRMYEAALVRGIRRKR